MMEMGIDLSVNKPKALTLDMLDAADRVVTMGCGAEATCPATPAETEGWELDDPEGKTLDQVRAIRDAVRDRVKDLVEAMSAV